MSNSLMTGVTCVTVVPQWRLLLIKCEVTHATNRARGMVLAAVSSVKWRYDAIGCERLTVEGAANHAPDGGCLTVCQRPGRATSAFVAADPVSALRFLPGCPEGC